MKMDLAFMFHKIKPNQTKLPYSSSGTHVSLVTFFLYRLISRPSFVPSHNISLSLWVQLQRLFWDIAGRRAGPSGSLL